MSLLRHVRSLHSLAPANKDHVSAWRVAISVAVPSLALLCGRRPELIIYAVFGALTGMYGRTEPHQLRLRHQCQAAVLLLAGVGVGVFLSVHHLHSWCAGDHRGRCSPASGSLFADKDRPETQRPLLRDPRPGRLRVRPRRRPLARAVAHRRRIGRVLHLRRLRRLGPRPHLAARRGAGRPVAARGTAPGGRGSTPPAT